MMTFKELKKLVKLPLYKEQRVPTVKALEESGVSVVAEKILENHGSISVYQNGYVIYRAHKRVTVFSLRNCVHYKYDALEGAGHHIEEEEFDEYEWHIRLVLEGEDRIFMNYEIIQGKWMPSREDREYREEILEGVDEAVSTLERMEPMRRQSISAERNICQSIPSLNWTIGSFAWIRSTLNREQSACRI